MAWEASETAPSCWAQKRALPSMSRCTASGRLARSADAACGSTRQSAESECENARYSPL